MGADYYESDKQQADLRAAGRVPIGIGAGSTISNTIVDKNARIGENCNIVNKVRNRGDGASACELTLCPRLLVLLCLCHPSNHMPMPESTSAIKTNLLYCL